MSPRILGACNSQRSSPLRSELRAHRPIFG
ncbi:hypothetical protein E2C01_079188 [Portunus trituberculatus]|uniref:Uncharacterized protein n=1 Tax=Portunus trituberculatus TaxID=210409 RepID=A0A5B7IIZ1_PORTR|nr:hypothetical protein [Portunus trituberculatus]